MRRLNKLLLALAVIAFASCETNVVDESPQDVSQQEVSEDDIEKTEIAIENVISSSTASSVDKFVSQIQKLENVKNVEVENELVYITTSAGELISVDLNGTTSQSPISAEDKVDTCGMYIQSLLDKIEYEIVDSVAENTEYDPIREDSADNIGNGEEPIETRAMRVPNRTVLSKMKMAVWCPWDEFKVYDESNFSSAVRDAKLECTIMNNFGPSSFASFGNYDLVFVSSHGSSDGAICIPQKYWNLYVEPYAKKKQDGKKYIDVNAAKQAGIRTHFEKNENGEILKSVALERVFFEKHLSKLTNTIIWTSACHLGRNNSAFLLGALTKGCPEFYGADNVCNGAGPMSVFRQFLPLFANGASTKVAYDKGMRYINRGSFSYRFVRHGNRNITYIKPYITGTKEINSKFAIVGTQYNFSLDIAGSTNSETPNQLGILLENLDESNSQRIPLSGSNIKCARSESWNGTICLYLADVQLNDLKPNTKYRYRSYVIVNNKIFYSEKVQTFKTREMSLCPDNHHPHAIDLGIGVKFACCNVEASSPIQYGNYYEWKEAPSAVVNWGGGWSVPSLSHFNLLTSCSYKWTSINGVNGMLFIGRNDNRIFLPAAGIRLYTGMHDVGVKGYYWASEHVGDDPDNGGCALYFSSSYPTTGYGFCYGYTIRPVAR